MRSEYDARPPEASAESPGASLARALFRLRGYTPIPLVAVALVGAHVTVISAAVGTACVALGEALRLWGVSHAGSATRTREIGAPSLVTSGPYAHTRNPLYLGNLLMTAGFVLFANAWMPWTFLAVLAAYALQYGLIVRLEEARLEDLFGDAYRAYRAAVPRFGVRLHAYDRSASRGRFRMAIVSEKRTFQTTVLLFFLLGARWYWSSR